MGGVLAWVALVPRLQRWCANVAYVGGVLVWVKCVVGSVGDMVGLVALVAWVVYYSE